MATRCARITLLQTPARSIRPRFLGRAFSTQVNRSAASSIVRCSNAQANWWNKRHNAGSIATKGAYCYSTAESSPPSKIYNFEDVKALVDEKDENIVLVDVREYPELEDTGVIPGAIHIPITTAPQSFHIPEQDFEDTRGYSRPGKDKTLVIYCKAGIRAHTAATLAKDAGWESVGEYPGSWLDWVKHGGPIDKK